MVQSNTFCSKSNDPPGRVCPRADLAVARKSCRPHFANPQNEQVHTEGGVAQALRDNPLHDENKRHQRELPMGLFFVNKPKKIHERGAFVTHGFSRCFLDQQHDVCRSRRFRNPLGTEKSNGRVLLACFWRENIICCFEIFSYSLTGIADIFAQRTRRDKPATI